MSPENVIEVRDVCKYFKVYEDKGHLLKDRIIHFNRNKYVKRDVLKGISFDVKRGEAVGLIGKNGCGKSTTLKMLARILRPNSGTINIRGKVYSMIELGAGFHPDMTGRENVYINASIFGITDEEVDRRINDIIRFSELEDVIDTPVRTYSSGMYMRLAFSIAINVEADILLVDEILAVGDSAFQTKCFNKLMSLKEEGVTIVLVSHSLQQVQKLCDRAIWIDDGTVREDGSAYRVTNDYTEESEAKRRARVREEMAQEEKEAEQESEELKQQLDEERARKDAERRMEELKKKALNRSCRAIAEQCGPDARREGSQEAHYSKVEVLGSEGTKRLHFVTGDEFIVKADYDCENPGMAVDFAINITRSDWVFVYGTTYAHTYATHVCAESHGSVEFHFSSLNLLGGTYYIDLRIAGPDHEQYDTIYSLFEIQVENSSDADVGFMPMAHEITVG